jgi:hypothetical protein
MIETDSVSESFDSSSELARLVAWKKFSESLFCLTTLFKYGDGAKFWSLFAQTLQHFA